MPRARFTAPLRAWVRAPGPAYARCLREEPVDIDVDRALAQHQGYVSALRRLGVEVVELPVAPELPDACFVEDPVVLQGGKALLTVPGAASRRPEAEGLRDVLAPELDLGAMALPATLDGGDVLRVGQRLFVGRSARSNAEGIAALEAFAAPLGLEVVAVDVAQGLHLKSACSLVQPGVVVVDRKVLDGRVFSGRGLDVWEAPEALGANVLAIGHMVMVSASAPKTAARLRTMGVDVVTVELDELHKGDGALTCLSVRQAPDGCWCA